MTKTRRNTKKYKPKNKTLRQSVNSCLLDRVATVDSRLVSEIHTQIQSVCFWALDVLYPMNY